MLRSDTHLLVGLFRVVTKSGKRYIGRGVGKLRGLFIGRS